MSDTLTLYYRQGCHLCEDMDEHLARLRGDGEMAFDLDRIDIDTNTELRARYNEEVPVLAQGDRILSRYFLDEISLRDALS